MGQYQKGTSVILEDLGKYYNSLTNASQVSARKSYKLKKFSFFNLVSKARADDQAPSDFFIIDQLTVNIYECIADLQILLT